MDNLTYIVNLLKEKFNFDCTPDDIAYEGIILDRDELDRRLLPEYFDEINTDDEVLIYFYSVDDYLVYIISDVDNYKWMLVGVLKDNRLIYSFEPEY